MVREGWVTAFAQTRSYPITLVPLRILKPHEETIEERVERLLEDIQSSRVLRRPILVDLKTMIILDGHHRVEALRRLGAKRIPAVLIDYDSGEVEVSSWREGFRVDKDLVRRAGLTGRRLPPRTSRHVVKGRIPEANTPLEELL